MIHSFDPIVDHGAKILILGSMPSAASLSCQEYYGHPQNRFWKMIASQYDVLLDSYESKINCLHHHGIALWDVISSCERQGSLDSNISDISSNDIASLVRRYPSIELIVCNGKMAGSIYRRQFASDLNLPYVILPSTSPANASYTLDRLFEEWTQYLP